MAHEGASIFGPKVGAARLLVLREGFRLSRRVRHCRSAWDFGDALQKLKGLASYASVYGAKFRRIESFFATLGDGLRVLDFKDDTLRDGVLSASVAYDFFSSKLYRHISLRNPSQGSPPDRGKTRPWPPAEGARLNAARV